MPKQRTSAKAIRRARYAAMYPDETPAQIDDRVRRSFTQSTDEGRARSRANLRPKAQGTKHRAKGATVAHKGKTRTLAGMPIVDFFTDCLHLPPFPAQRVLLKRYAGESLDSEERDILHTITDGAEPSEPTGPAVELVAILGGRSGKSAMGSGIATYECLVNGDKWRTHLDKGEVGYAVIVATRLAQARNLIQSNAARMIQNSPELCGFLKEEPTQEKVLFTNDLCIYSIPANSTAGRGLPIFLLALDEVGHFFCEGVKADKEIYNSLSPRLAQFRGAKTILLSTPSAKQGLLWDWFNEGYQVPGRVTFRAPSTTMNPTLDPDYLARMKARDPDNYSREFDAEFCERVSTFFPADLLDKCFTLAGDLPPRRAVQYRLGIDQSGFTGRDRFGLCISHREPDGRIFADVCRAWDSTDPDEVLKEIKELREQYHVKEGLIDAYGSGWVRSALEKIGLKVERRAALPVVYMNAKSLMIAGRLHLPEHADLRAGFENTRAFFGRNNAISIQHERGPYGHADMCDAVCTATWVASDTETLTDEGWQEIFEGPKPGERESFFAFYCRKTQRKWAPGFVEPQGQLRADLHRQWVESERQRLATERGEQPAELNTTRPAFWRPR